MNLLIVGKHSYIGCHIGKLAETYGASVEYLSVRDDTWKSYNIHRFDAVVFAAAIVHRKDADWEEYNAVNVCLPHAFASEAKAQGVKHFLFLSTAAVYGAEKEIPGRIIDGNTPLKPQSNYGKSKLEAEHLLQALASDAFTVSILRPMNVYGKGCPGGYISKFQTLTSLLPVLPDAYRHVKQGMVHVDHLSRLAWMILENKRGGIYHAQDPCPISSIELMEAISAARGKRKPSIPCSWAIRPLEHFSPIKKLFGGVAYAQELAHCTMGTYANITTQQGIQTMVEES